MPPAPTELLLVTRMGDNTSPILLTNVPQPIATFNRPFELSELVGNIDGVMYLYTGEAVNVTCVSDIEEGETKYFIAYDNGDAHIGELTVEGTTLLCSEKGNENYLFDLDFKHQNRKFFEQANGTYAVALPWLGLDAESKVLVSVSGESSKTVTIHYVDNDYRAWGQAGGGIREISWFNELLTSANITNIEHLVDKIIKLEYSPEAAGGITVTSANTQPSTVTGNWNLLADGTAFIPLSIVSRFPNGSPIIGANIDNNGVILCTFNRSFNENEVVGKVEALMGYPNSVIQKASLLTYGDNDEYLGLIQEESGDVQGVEIDGNVLKATNASDLFNIYDIDYDHQFRRSLPAAFVKWNVQIPQLLDNPSAGQGFGIMRDAGGQPTFGVCTAQDNAPYIIEDNTWLSEKGAWANSLTWANVQTLLQKIIAMEFEGFDVEPPLIDPVGYREALATGWVVTPLIPQSLS